MSREVGAVEIDLSRALATARELVEELEKLDGTEVDEAPTRAARRQHVHLTRTLLRLSHLGNRASVEIMDAYHDFKLRDEPPTGE
ncbi:hypothetical protein [Streptomyces sp. NBC_00079]|uniref:hypothetical protein n=1 Tax=Streptomyces sp. NBC_00079 TaxID=2975644 RepID=UPI00324C9F96